MEPRPLKRKTPWVFFILLCAAFTEVSCIPGCPFPCVCENIQGPSIKKIHCNGTNLNSFPWTLPVTTAYLNLSDNHIRYLSSGMFSKTTELKELDLSKNQLKNIPRGIFDKNTQLEKLYLQWNKMTSLAPGIFSKLTGLQDLDISNNDIGVLPEKTLENLPMLEYFMAGNKLKNITATHFSNNKDLVYVFLQKNSISHLPSKSFNLPKLQYLILTDNPITKVDSEAFRIPNKTLYIYLIRTMIETVSLRSFTKELNSNVSVFEGRLGVMRFMDSYGKERCIVEFGLGTSENLTIPKNETKLLIAFRRGGFENKGTSENVFSPCLLGTFLNASRRDFTEYQCVECPAGGYFSDTQGYVGITCRHCPIGTYVHFDKAPGTKRRHCVACPKGSNTSDFAGLRGCRCLRRFARRDMFGECKPCSEIAPKAGLVCPNDYVTIQRGFWWKWRNKTQHALYQNFTRNIRENISIGGSNSAIAKKPGRTHVVTKFPSEYILPNHYHCPREASCKGEVDAECEFGYEGPLCQVCIPGYYHQLKLCSKCPTRTWLIAQLSITAALIAIIIGLVLWMSKKKNKRGTGRSSVDMIFARLKIAIISYQMTSQVQEAFPYVQWPDSLQLVGKYSEIVQLNFIQLAPLHCLFPELKADAFTSLFSILSINAAAIMIALVIYGLTVIILMLCSSDQRDKEKKFAKAKQLIFSGLFFVLYLTYLPTCSKTVQVLPHTCIELCDDETVKDCPWFLVADFTVQCHTPEFNRSVIVAYFAFVYIIFLPVAAMLILVWKRQKVSAGRQAENKASDAQQQITEVVGGLRFLVENFQPRLWYWEFFETARRLALTSVMYLVAEDNRVYIGFACVGSGLYGLYYGEVAPIVDPFEMELMQASLTITFLNLGVGSVSKIPQENIPVPVKRMMETFGFKLAVIAANFLVVALMVDHYLRVVQERFIDWLGNRRWSFSSLVAILVPLDELQDELPELDEEDDISKQLQTAKMNIPFISSTSGFKYTRAVESDEESLEGSKTSDDKDAIGSSEQHVTSHVNAGMVYSSESDISIAESALNEQSNESNDTLF